MVPPAQALSIPYHDNFWLNVNVNVNVLSTQLTLRETDDEQLGTQKSGRAFDPENLLKIAHWDPNPQPAMSAYLIPTKTRVHECSSMLPLFTSLRYGRSRCVNFILRSEVE
jgi:hypothetical protein